MDQARPYVSMGGPVFFVFFTPDADAQQEGTYAVGASGKDKTGLVL